MNRKTYTSSQRLCDAARSFVRIAVNRVTPMHAMNYRTIAQLTEHARLRQVTDDMLHRLFRGLNCRIDTDFRIIRCFTG